MDFWLEAACFSLTLYQTDHSSPSEGSPPAHEGIFVHLGLCRFSELLMIASSPLHHSCR
jgi:hypothetical protein